jgi:hypothetical protein
MKKEETRNTAKLYNKYNVADLKVNGRFRLECNAKNAGIKENNRNFSGRIYQKLK